MNTIATPQDVRSLGRPLGKISDDKVLAYIMEVEMTIVRKMLGDVLYLELCEKGISNLDDDKRILVEGGKFDNGSRFVTGLLTAIAYYVYAQNVRTGDFASTRYGMVVKEDQYSTPISSKERAEIADGVTVIAEEYMRECIEYCRFVGIAVKGISQGMNTTAGCIIRKIKNV